MRLPASATYNFSPKFEAGVAGYAFQQITADKINGISQAKSKTTNVSMGPGAFWFYNPKNLIEGEVNLPVIQKNSSSGVTACFATYIYSNATGSVMNCRRSDAAANGGLVHGVTETEVSTAGIFLAVFGSLICDEDN